MVWIAAGAAAHRRATRLTNVVAAQQRRRAADAATEWHFWFVEALVYILLALAAAARRAARCDRLERRYPFGLPLALAGARPGRPVRPARPRAREPPAARRWSCSGCSRSAGPPPGRARGRQRLLVTARRRARPCRASSATPQREALIVAGLAAAGLGADACRASRLVNRVAGVLAGGSLYIYLTHWQVYPHLGTMPWLALAARWRWASAYAAPGQPVRRWLSRWRLRWSSVTDQGPGRPDWREPCHGEDAMTREEMLGVLPGQAGRLAGPALGGRRGGEGRQPDLRVPRRAGGEPTVGVKCGPEPGGGRRVAAPVPGTTPRRCPTSAGPGWNTPAARRRHPRRRADRGGRRLVRGGGGEAAPSGSGPTADSTRRRRPAPTPAAQLSGARPARPPTPASRPAGPPPRRAGRRPGRARSSRGWSGRRAPTGTDSTSRTDGSRCSLTAARSSSETSSSSHSRAAHSATSWPVISCASRNGTPRRTSQSATSVASV